jgi:inner membrane protein
VAVDPLTHLATGVICSQLLSTPSRWWAALAGAVFAVLPDLDYFFIFWDRLAFIRYHRGITHSLVALPLFALAGALLGRLLGGPRWFKPLLILGVVVLLSHLLLDLATSYGTQLFSPFSRRRLSLDWIFIIDPYFTALLVVGAVASLAFPLWGPRVGAGVLVTAATYLLVCASYHHQALNLAQRVFQTPNCPGPSVAALPQPFSCRRWHLITASEAKILQAFVQLPYVAALGLGTGGGNWDDLPDPRTPGCPTPATPYQKPGCLTIQTWTPAPATARVYSPEAEAILAAYLDFARFPLLRRTESREGEQLLEWLDLRFSVPGRAFPLVLQLRLDAQGRLRDWLIGHQGWVHKQ